MEKGQIGVEERPTETRLGYEYGNTFQRVEIRGQLTFRHVDIGAVKRSNGVSWPGGTQ